MKIIHMLNVADYLFMALGLVAALLMIAVGTNGDRQQGDKPRNEKRVTSKGS